MDIQEAREKYKDIYGKYPNKKSSLETIMAKIQAETPAPEPKEKPKLVVSEGTPGEAKLGRGRHTQHRVFFKGHERYWTVPTIVAMSKDPQLRALIEFPPDSEYEEAVNYETCKSCG
jgi:hypothetical protein